MTAFELVGLPGSGKSTVFRILGESLRAGRDLRAGHLPSLEVAIRYFSNLDPDLLGLADRACSEVVTFRVSRGELDRASMHAFHLRDLIGRACEVAVAESERAAVILEEGTVHQTWRLGQLLREADLPRSFFREVWCAMPLPSFALELVASTEVRHARLSGRRTFGPVNRVLAREDPMSPLWVQAGADYDEVVNLAVRRGMRVYRVDNDGDKTPEQAASDVLSLVSEIVHGTVSA